MAHRLLPFRQYDENDVVNLFALSTEGPNLKLALPNDDGDNADGVLVAVSAGNMNDNDVIDVDEDSRFANSYASPVGRNPYPTNPLKVSTPAASGDAALGVTFRQTLSVDENGESLLFNPVKKDELNAVLSGQTVPVCTKGIITVTSAAVHDDILAIGDALTHQGAGKFGKKHATSDALVGTLLATGHRGANGPSPSVDSWSGKYYVIKLDC